MTTLAHTVSCPCCARSYEAAFVHRIEPVPPTIYDAADAFERGGGEPVTVIYGGHPMAARLWHGWVQIVASGCVGGVGLFEEVRREEPTPASGDTVPGRSPGNPSDSSEEGAADRPVVGGATLEVRHVPDGD